MLGLFLQPGQPAFQGGPFPLCLQHCPAGLGKFLLQGRYTALELPRASLLAGQLLAGSLQAGLFLPLCRNGGSDLGGKVFHPIRAEQSFGLFLHRILGSNPARSGRTSV